MLEHGIRELALAGQNILDVENLRMHYAYTFRLWLDRFEVSREKIESMFGREFFRCWRIYLNVGLSSFEYGGNRLFQILCSKGLNNGLPLTRDHLYGIEPVKEFNV